MLCPFELKAFSEKFNELKLYDDGNTPMEKFTVTTT